MSNQSQPDRQPAAEPTPPAAGWAQPPNFVPEDDIESTAELAAVDAPAGRAGDLDASGNAADQADAQPNAVAPVSAEPTADNRTDAALRPAQAEDPTSQAAGSAAQSNDVASDATAAAQQAAASWQQPPGTARVVDDGWTLSPLEEKRVLVGAVESSSWQSPLERENQAQLVASSARPTTASRHFEYANQECDKCGGTIGWDGYCEQCGAKAASSRDRYAQSPADWVAGLTDKGIRHYRNEDAIELAADEKQGSLAICLVCDGVSSSTDSDVASLAAVQAATRVLRQRSDEWAALAKLNEPLFDVQETDDETLIEVSAVVLAAIWSASEAVLANTFDVQGNPPSCTLVAGLVREDHMLVASIGDSRAYWVPDEGEALQLSVDDSVAQEQIALGVPREQAENGPKGHIITRWLGNDAPELRPHLTVLPPQESAGYLVVCSDGLWNYASEPQVFATLIKQAVSDNHGELTAACADLIDWANEQGGIDNITVSLARVGAAQQAAQPAAADQLDAATIRLRPAES